MRRQTGGQDFAEHEHAGWEARAAGYDDHLGRITVEIAGPLLDADRGVDSLRVVGVDVLAQQASQVILAWSRSSRRTLPTKRSAVPFCHGLWNDVRSGVMRWLLCRALAASTIDTPGEKQPDRLRRSWTFSSIKDPDEF